MERNEALRSGMHEAMRQLHAGRLHDATATIQRTLRGLAPEAASAAAATTGERPIEGSFHRVALNAVSRPASAKPSQAPAHERFSQRRAPGSPSWGHARPAHRPAPMPARARAEQPAGQFLCGSYAASAGTRAYKLYIPTGHREQALPLVVMLHGCTQDPDDFAAGTRMNALAEEHGCLVLYPQQPSNANPSKCWNWFEASHQQRDRGEPAIIAGMTRHIISHYPVDPRRVYIAGLSAGGAMATVMGRTYPDLYAAIGVHSGLPYAIARDLPSAFAAMNQMGTPLGVNRNSTTATAERFVPTIVFHGDRDTTVHPRNGDEVIAQCTTIYSCNGADAATAPNPQVTLRQGQVPDGHAYTRAVYRDANGRAILEQWRVHGAGHAWSGGSPHGSYTDPKGPNATREMIRFFYQHTRT
jgi:poly(hydroxyalkanoate) depolymerase family esterase